MLCVCILCWLLGCGGLLIASKKKAAADDVAPTHSYDPQVEDSQTQDAAPEVEMGQTHSQDQTEDETHGGELQETV